MVSHRSLWVLMGSDGFFRFFIGSYGSLYVLLCSYAFLWICMGIGLYGSLWVLVGPYGSL